MGITPEIVDQELPLQEPGGAAETIKAMLQDGQTIGAEDLYSKVRFADHTTVEQTADAILTREGFDPNNLDLLRALRLGIKAGMDIGRQEGANVVSKILEGTEEGE